MADEHSAGVPIDTAPTTPKPPVHFVDAAARDIPSVVTDIKPSDDGAIELVASHLTKQLQEVDSPTQSEPAAQSVKAGEAYLRTIENDPDAKAALEHVHARLHVFAKAMQEAMNSPEYRASQELERRRWQDLADAIRANVEWAGDELAARHFARPQTIEDWEHLARIVEIPAETIRTGDLKAREIFACAQAWADRQTIKAKLAADTKADSGNGDPAEPASDSPAPKKGKRSTERGEGRAKLIAALTKHHKYADGGCLNLEPIGNNELARLAKVSESTASTFFNNEFNGGASGGHTKYRKVCGDVARLVTALKLLNQEFSPHHLFGTKPPDEGEREDEE